MIYDHKEILKRINKINLNKVIKMSEQNELEILNKFGMRENIKTTAFIAWLVTVFVFILTLEIEVNTAEGVTRIPVWIPLTWANPWIKAVVYILITASMIIFALDKGTGAFFKAIIAQLYDPRMSNAAKVEYVTKQIEKLTGIAMMLNESETLKRNSDTIKKNSEAIIKNANKVMGNLSDSVPPPPSVPPKNEEIK